MFRTKKDLDKHVSDIFSKIHNENERNLRGYSFARMYYQLKDYETAKRYLVGFLSVRDHHAPSHKLMAQIHEATKNLERALHSYKRSLEIDQNQKDIVLKICELYCQLPVDHETARYWADRADQLFPHHETVFNLRECLVNSEGEPNRHELENLITAELAARPRDVKLRIKLLKLLLDTERIQEAYSHALTVESKRPYFNNVDWYYCLVDVFEAYQEDRGHQLDTDFYIHFLAIMDHLVALALAEPYALSNCGETSKHSCSIADAASVLHMFDQQLHEAWKRPTPHEGAWGYFLHHMRGQLYFRMATLLFKRAKKDHGNWKEACRCGAALFLISYTFKPSNLLQETWFMQLNENQKIFTDFFQQRNLCMSQSGHVIISLCKEDKGKWLQKIKQDVCLPQVQERTYQRLFNSPSQKQAMSTSHFLQDNTFFTSSLEFPVMSSLQEYNKVAHKLYPDSLHHLVWLSLHLYGDKGSKRIHPNYEIQIFDGLRFSSNVTTNGSPESLSQLDIEAFLHATVYTSFHAFEHRKAKVNPRAADNPLSVPADIAEQLCSHDQADWWRAAHGLYTNIFREKLGEQRRILQHGLEVIRGVGNHGLDINLVVHLARTFANKAADLCGQEEEEEYSEEVVKLKSRAAHYWSLAKKMLDKLSAGHIIKLPKDRLFQSHSNELSSEEITSLQEEAQLFLACQAMNSGHLDTAATLLSSLSSAHASFYLALTLKRLAHQQIENHPQHDIPPQLWNNHIALLTKSQEALYATMDRIRGDRNHPLNIELLTEIEDIETKLAAVNLKSGGPVDSRDNDVDDEIVGEESPPLSRNGTPQRDKNIINAYQSTPNPPSSFLTPHSKNSNINLNCKSGIKHTEPSPERLDAQVRLLARSQDTLVRTLLEQQHTLVETNRAIVEALQQNKVVVEQLKKYLENIQDTINKGFNQHSHLKSDSVKGHGEDEEEEYQDNCDRNGCYLDYYVEDSNHNAEFRDSFHYPQPHVVTEASGASTISYVPQPPPQTAPLNHYSYQYPPPPTLTQPPPPPATSIADRSRYFSSLGPGLPFSEGQQLPQFHFHVGIPHSKPPVFSRLGPSHLTTVASTPPIALPPPPLLPPWAKSGVPHAFQIPLPPTAVPASPLSQPPSVLSTPSPFIDVNTTTPTPAVLPQPVLSVAQTTTNTAASQLKALLTTPSSTAQSSTVLPVIQPNVVNGILNCDVPSAGLSPYSGEVVPDKKVVRNGIRHDSDINESGGSEAECHGDGDVLGDFTPVIPLPAEVAVRTGEEDEKVFFEERAKLFRFVGREWKERGVGTVKLLVNEVSNKVRLLMRRDQVLKVCANHYIVSNMELHPMKDTDRAFIWTAQDFADEEIKVEQFCIRFKTADIAVSFKKAFEKALSFANEFEQKIVEKENENADIKSGLSETSAVKSSSLAFSGSTKGFGSEFLPKPNTWNCSVCLVNNSSDKSVCVACESLKPGTHPLPKTMFTITQTSSGFSGEGTFGGKSLSSQPISGFTLSQSTSKMTFSPSIVGGFGDKLIVTPAVSVLPCTSANSVQGFGPASKILNQLATQNQDKHPEHDVASTSVRTVVGGFTFTTAPVIQESVSSDKPERDIIIVTSKAKEASQSNKHEIGKSPFATFSFSLKTNDKGLEKKTEPKEETLFGMKSDVSKLDFSSVSSTDCGFQKDSNFKGFAGAGTTVFSSRKEKNISKESSLDTEAPEEFVPTVEFKPIVPLPELVEVKTGEEEEEKIFGERAKLFRFDADGKMWKERGVGELKILRHAKTGKYRLLMRREQVLKLCANHYIHPDIKLTTLSSSDRAWVWLAQDYADGELRQEKFAAKFKTVDIAQEFQKIFEKCQEVEDSKVSEKSVVSTNSFSKEDQCSDYRKSLEEMFKLKPGQWECRTCYVINNTEHNSCVACKAIRSPKNLQNSHATELTFGKFNLGAQHDSMSSKSEMSDQFTMISNSSDKTNLFSDNTSQSSNFKFCQSPSQFSGGHLFGFRPNVTTANQTGLVFGNQPLTVSTTVATSNSLFTSTTSNSSSSTQTSVFAGVKSKFESSTPLTFSVCNNSNSAGSLFQFGTLSDAALPANASLTTEIEDTSSPLGISDSVQFRFGSPQKFEFSFSGVRPRSPSKTPKSPSTPSDGDKEGGDDEVESPEADIYFQPVIPLPPKVDILTGEEDEDILFSRRAKLFRFIDGEWKERGIGDIKILQHKKLKSVRLLMRRDQVLKVCINHYVSPEMKFCAKGEKSWMWTANDFSDNEPLPEKFAVRFKTVDAAIEFKKIVDDGQEFLKLQSKEKEVTKENPSKIAANTISPISTSTSSSFSFRQASESIRSPPLFSLSSRFGTSPVLKGSVFGNICPKSELSSSTDNQTSDDIIIIEEKKCSPEKILLAESLLLPPNFFLYELKEPCKGCRGCTDLEEKEEDPEEFLYCREDDDYHIIYETKPTAEQVEKATKLKLPLTFFLYENMPPCKGCRGCTDDIPPYKENQDREDVSNSDDSIAPEVSLEEANNNNMLFKSQSSTSFAELAAKNTLFLTHGSVGKPNVFDGAGTPLFSESSLNQSKENEEDTVAPVQDIHFEPVIPLPDLVEIKTGEEDEIPIFCHRAKLYRYDSNSKQWKERGLGDFKILKHKDKCSYRLLMRRGQVHKVACNHYLTSSLELKPLSTSDNTLCWTAVDFTEEQSTLETFCIKFKSKDTCTIFKEKIEECKNALFKSCDSTLKENCDSIAIKESTDSHPSHQGDDKSSNPSEPFSCEDSTKQAETICRNDDSKIEEERHEEEEDEDENIMFEKRITLAVYDENIDSYKQLGIGTLRILYDDEVYGARIKAHNDSDVILCDHIIAVQTCLRVDEKNAFWAAMDMSVDPAERRQFKATFSSLGSIEEFSKIFEEGKTYAVESEILEKTDNLPPATCRGIPSDTSDIFHSSGKL